MTTTSGGVDVEPDDSADDSNVSDPDEDSNFSVFVDEKVKIIKNQTDMKTD